MIKKQTIWRKPRAVSAVMLIAVTIAIGAAIFITDKTPYTYSSTAKLQMGSPAPLLSNQSNQSTNFGGLYLALLDDPSFKKRMVTKSGNHESTFNVNAKIIENTNLLEIKVESDSPASAKILANIASKVLVAKSNELQQASFKDASSKVELALLPIDEELKNLRNELINIQTTAILPVDINSSIKAEHLKDQIAATESKRRTISDYLSKVYLNDLLQKNNLRIVYHAEVPQHPSGPSLINNIMIAMVIGCLIGLLVLSSTDLLLRG